MDGYDRDCVVVAISRDGSRGSAISRTIIFALEYPFPPAAPDHGSRSGNPRWSCRFRNSTGGTASTASIGRIAERLRPLFQKALDFHLASRAKVDAPVDNHKDDETGAQRDNLRPLTITLATCFHLRWLIQSLVVATQASNLQRRFLISTTTHLERTPPFLTRSLRR